ncbi:MAG: benzoate-CoA ligase family protein, partial [Candidatus Rokubacteria bacterium]|nr:benzoate-CoA ligase family protein [Candidatus Rokubacteria bacterium]
MNLATWLVDRHVAEGHGARTAIVCEERRVSYAELQGLVNHAGNALAALGVKPEQRVALLLPDIPEFIATFLGAAKLGAVAVPVNTLLRAEELAYILNHSRARVLVAHEGLVGEVRKARPGLPFLRHLLVVGRPGAGEADLGEALARASAALEPVPTEPDDAVLWAYSSGSTGAPKAAVHSHANLQVASRLFADEVLKIAPDDRSLATPKLFFTFGLGVNMYVPLRAASTVILNPRPPAAEAVLGLIHRERPTLFYAVPTHYIRMLQVPDAARRFDLSSIRLCFAGGEPLAPDVFRRWREAFGLEVLEFLGSSEALFLYLANRPGEARPGSVGRPLPDYALRLADAEGRDVPPGEPGILALQGPTLFHHYARRPDLTRRAFRGEWFLTGDQFRQDAEGYYWFLGRTDDMLRVAGAWVAPAEVEGVLMEHPAVLECAVVGARDADGTTRPRACVVPRPGAAGDDALRAALIAFARERLAAYKVPRWVEFIPELPKTVTGKTQRFRLRAGHAPAPPAEEGAGVRSTTPFSP